MGYLITAMVSFFAFLDRKSKYVFGAMVGLLWILMALNINNPDYYNYKAVYDNIDDSVTLGLFYGGLANESGFRLIYKMLFQLGFSYTGFLMVFSAVGLILIGRVIWKYSVTPNFILFLYFIFPFTIDYVQLRTFMSMAIVLHGITYLIEERKPGEGRWVSTAKYAFCVIIASTIHVSAIFFIVLVAVRYLSVRQCWILSLLGIAILVLMYTHVDVVTDLVSAVIPPNKIKTWLSGEMKRSFRSVMSTVCVRGAWMLLIEYFYEGYLRKCKRGQIRRDVITENLYKCNILMFVMLGLEIFTKEYERIGRITFVIGYIIFSRLISLRRTKALPWLIVIGVLGIHFIYFMFFSEVGTGTFFDYVFRHLFESNRLLNGV